MNSDIVIPISRMNVVVIAALLFAYVFSSSPPLAFSLNVPEVGTAQKTCHVSGAPNLNVYKLNLGLQDVFESNRMGR